MNRRAFFSQLCTTTILVKLSSHPLKAHQSALSRSEALGLLRERSQEPAWWYAVPNRPLTAILHEHRRMTFSDGTRSELACRNKLFRDAAGRVRLEQYVIDPRDGQVLEWNLSVDIADPLAGELKTLFPRDGVATKQPRRPITEGASGEPAGEPSRADRSYESIHAAALGPRMLEGIEGHGLLITAILRNEQDRANQPTQETLEEWVALGLSTPLLTHQRSGHQGWESEHVVSLSNLLDGEPDPALFQIPPEFRLVDPKDAPHYGYIAQRK